VKFVKSHLMCGSPELLILVALIAVPAVSAQPQTQRGVPPPSPRSNSPAGGARVVLAPKLVRGDVMRYRIQFQTTSQTSHSGAVQDPQGPSQLTVTWDATIRLEVLDQKLDPQPAPTIPSTTPPNASASSTATSQSNQAVRLRTTYEKSGATVQSDTPDPAAEGIEKQYSQLENQSMEFTLRGDGQISDVRGLEGILSDENARKAAEQWMMQLSGSASSPPGGIVPGQKWTSNQPATSLPLSGLVWQTESTYLRDELCHTSTVTGASPAQNGESCAVILTRTSLVQPRHVNDPTPEDYRRNGMTTSGSWRGSGESLTYVSLKTGWVVSVTQSGDEQMDFTVSSGSGEGVHVAGTVRTSSGVSLLQTNGAVATPPAPRPPSGSPVK